MAKLTSAVGRTDGKSGYGKLLGSVGIGEVLSRLHGTIISGGMLLPAAIAAQMQPPQLVASVDDFIAAANAPLDSTREQYTVAAFNVSPGSNRQVNALLYSGYQSLVRVCQLTEASQWDSEKADGARKALDIAVDNLSDRLADHLEIRRTIVSFSGVPLYDVQAGFKRRFGMSELLSGRGFCWLIGVNYQTVLDRYAVDQADNLRELVRQLTDCPDFARELENQGWQRWELDDDIPANDAQLAALDALKSNEKDDGNGYE